MIAVAAPAQLITPAPDSPDAPSEPAPKKRRAPVLAAKWPFKFNRLFGKKKTAGGDPFLEQGAQAQANLAATLTGQSQPTTETAGDAPNQPTYPWPTPIDTNAPFDGPGGGPDTWKPNATAQYSPPTTSQPTTAPAQFVPNSQVGGVTTAGGSPPINRTSAANQNYGQQMTARQRANNSAPPPPVTPIAAPQPTQVASTATAPPSLPPTTAPPQVPSPAPRTVERSPMAKQPTPPPSSSTIAGGTAVVRRDSGFVPTSPTQNQVQAVAQSQPAVPQAQPTIPPSRPAAPQSQPAIERQNATALQAGPPTAPPTFVPAPTSKLPPPTVLAGGSANPVPPSVSTAPPAQTPPMTQQQMTLPRTAFQQTVPKQSRNGDFRVANIDQGIWGTPMHGGANQLAANPAAPTVPAPDRQFDTVRRPGANIPPTTPGQPTQIATTISPGSTDAQASASREIVRPKEGVFQPQPNAEIFVNPEAIQLEKPADGAQQLGVEHPGTKLLATVGTQSILLGDVLGQINEMLLPYKEQLDNQALQQQRDILVRQFLPQVIERKLIFNDFLGAITPDKLPEIERSIYDHFMDNRLPEILKNTGLKSERELDARLRKLGSSLANQQRLFFEQMVAMEAVKREVADRKEVSHQELLDYYHQHSDEYEFPAQVRWEQLVVEKSRMESPTKAYNALAALGNQVFQGADFGEIAKEHSHGPRGFAGGRYDWTTKGSLVAKEIDRVLFMLPPGKLSRIIENGETYHIVRVIERKAAGREPFTIVQAGIKKAIEKQRREETLAKYIKRLKSETAVWVNPDFEAVAPPEQQAGAAQ